MAIEKTSWRLFPSARQNCYASVRSWKPRIILWLLNKLGYIPGSVIVRGNRKYIIDTNGAQRRLGREA